MSTKPQGKRPKNCHAVKGSPYWQYEILINGHRERGSTGCTTARDAEQFVASRRHALKAAVTSAKSGEPISKGTISLADAFDRYENDVAKGQKAYPTYRYQLEYLLMTLPEDLGMHEITHAVLMQYRLDRGRQITRRGTPPNGQSVNREVELLRRVWKHFAELEFEVGREPKWGLDIARGAEVQRVRELAPNEEARLMPILDVRAPELARIVEFATLCGQRKSAIITLRRDHVDIENRFATIYLKAKGDALKPHRFPLTTRMIEIIQSFPVVEEVANVFTFVCRRAALAREDRPARVRGQRYPFTTSGWSRQWRAILKEAGIEDFRFHDLRHTAATRIVRATGNLKVAQNLLAHSDITQTARYAHAFHADIADAMDKASADAARKRKEAEERLAAKAA